MGYINGIKGKEVQVIKKILFLTMALILGVLAGCTENVPEIDGFEWKMESVQQGSDGRYIFCSPEMSDIFENVEIADVECVASDGKITVINNADGKVCDLPLVCAGLTPNERQILREGCLMNYYAAGFGKD